HGESGHTSSPRTVLRAHEARGGVVLVLRYCVPLANRIEAESSSAWQVSATWCAILARMSATVCRIKREETAVSATVETARAASMTPTQAPSKHILGGVGFDRIMVLICAWPLLGGYLDGWAHGHLPETTETFFTPWHGVLYSGFLAVGLTLGAVFLRNVLRGMPVRRALPHGYGLSLLGFCLVVLGGPGHLLWPSLFGIEVQVEATLSPTHLTLAAAIALIVTGPLRAGWVRHEATRNAGWRALFPAVLSLALFLSMMTLI